MAAVDLLDAWEEMIIARAPRVPSALMYQAVRETLREFLQFTRAWQYVPAAQNIVATQASYALSVPAGFAAGSTPEVITAQWVQVSNPAGSGGSPSAFKTREWLDENIPAWRGSQGDDFRYYTSDAPGTIIFSAAPTSSITGGLKTRVSLKPPITAQQVDDSVFNQWGEEIAQGSLGRLLSMPEERWSKPKQGEIELAHYRAGRGRARIKVEKSFGNAEMTYQAKYGFAGVRA